MLADDLIQYTIELAYAESERLSGCLDLIHVPSQQLWLEWLEATRQSKLREVPASAGTPCYGVRRTGVLIAADPTGRAGTMRTFWSTQNEQVYSAALLTYFDLDRVVRPTLDVGAVFSGAPFGVVIPVEAALDELLSHICFRLDPAWANYYRAADLPESQQLLMLREVLGTMAFDMPMIMALFLLFAAKDGLQRQAADLQRLNRTRHRRNAHSWNTSKYGHRLPWCTNARRRPQLTPIDAAVRACTMCVAISPDAAIECSGACRTCAAALVGVWCGRGPCSCRFTGSYRVFPNKRSRANR